MDKILFGCLLLGDGDCIANTYFLSNIFWGKELCDMTLVKEESVASDCYGEIFNIKSLQFSEGSLLVW